VLRRVVALVALVGALLAACGDDEEPSRTIAFLRAVGVAETSQAAFFDELAAAGWTEGDNLTVLARDAEEAYADPEDAEEAARGFVEEGADLIVALASSSAIAAREVAGDVPVLFLVNDPVAAGLVSDERAPDGNLTGTSFRVPADRTLDVLASLGDIDTVGLVGPENDPGAVAVREDFVDAADQLGLDAIDASFADVAEAGDAVREAAAAGADALAVLSSPTSVQAFDAIAAAAIEVGLPTIANTNVAEFALIVLSPDGETVYRQMGRQAARLLDGIEVSEVPVEDPASFTLTVRRSVADELGIRLPEELLDRADEVLD